MKSAGYRTDIMLSAKGQGVAIDLLNRLKLPGKLEI